MGLGGPGTGVHAGPQAPAQMREPAGLHGRCGLWARAPQGGWSAPGTQQVGSRDLAVGGASGRGWQGGGCVGGASACAAAACTCGEPGPGSGPPCLPGCWAHPWARHGAALLSVDPMAVSLARVRGC